MKLVMRNCLVYSLIKQCMIKELPFGWSAFYGLKSGPVNVARNATLCGTNLLR